MDDMFRLPVFADVQAAHLRQAGIVRETPILVHPQIDAMAGAEIFVKAECLQVTGSFKIRGAYNRLAQIPADLRRQGVVAFSSGNHAQGVARAARLIGMPATIVMPDDAPQVKVDGVLADRAEIVFYDRHRESREAISAQLAKDRGAIVVPSYDDFDIIAGQGTIGIEFANQMEQAGGPLDHLVCCAGGGGLITGAALAIEALAPETKVWTAEPDGHDDWARSLELGEIVANSPGTRSICDAILTPEPGRLTFPIGKRLLAGGLTVSDNNVRDAMRAAFRYLRIVAEPGGAAALASVVRGVPADWRGKRVGVIVTGGNVDAGVFATIIAGGLGERS